MKIVTTDKSAYNKTVRYVDNIMISWDDKGESDQPENICNILTSQYSFVMTEEAYNNREIVPEVNGKKIDPAIMAKIDDLSSLVESKQESIDHLNRILSGEKMIRKDLEDEVSVLRNSAKELERTVAELIDKNQELKIVIEKGFEKASEKTLRDKLSEKKKGELVDYCVELELDEKDYKDLSKADLINFIIQKVENAND